MNLEAVQNVMNEIENINIGELDVIDQLKFIEAMHTFAETVRPIVIKNNLEKSSGSTFLFKMGANNQDKV